MVSLLWLIFKMRLKYRLILSAAALFIIFSAVLFSFAAGSMIWKEVREPAKNEWLVNNSPEKRVLIWNVISKLVFQRWLLGYGLDNIDTAYANYFAGLNFNSVTDPAYYSLKNIRVNRAHSYPLDILMFSGAVGFMAWLFLIYTCLKKARSWQRVFLLVYLAWTLVQIQSTAHLMLFYFVLGRNCSGFDKTF